MAPIIKMATINEETQRNFQLVLNIQKELLTLQFYSPINGL